MDSLPEERVSALSDHEDFNRTLLRPWSFVSQRELASESSATDDVVLKENNAKYSNRKRLWRRPLRSRWFNKGEITSSPPGWWGDQMLFDRTLRSMAALMTLYAFIITVICARNFKPLITRSNKSSTSVGLNKDKMCKDLKSTEIVSIIQISSTRG